MKKVSFPRVDGAGIDIVEVKRFRAILRSKNNRFLQNTFSAAERTYCLSYDDPAPHFAGTFAAKEAAQKACGIFSRPFPTIVHTSAVTRLIEMTVSIMRGEKLVCSGIVHVRVLP